MNVTVRLLRADNHSKLEEKSAVGPCWVEIYQDETLVAKMLVGRQEIQK